MGIRVSKQALLLKDMPEEEIENLEGAQPGNPGSFHPMIYLKKSNQG